MGVEGCRWEWRGGDGSGGVEMGVEGCRWEWRGVDESGGV